MGHNPASTERGGNKTLCWMVADLQKLTEPSETLNDWFSWCVVVCVRNWTWECALTSFITALCVRWHRLFYGFKEAMRNSRALSFLIKKRASTKKHDRSLRFKGDLMHVLIWVPGKQKDKEQSDKIIEEEHGWLSSQCLWMWMMGFASGENR